MKEYILSTIHFGVLLFLAYLLIGSVGIIKIERPYYNEYKSCRDDLKVLQKEIKCPEVKCTTGAVGIFWSVIGFVAMAFGMLFWWHTNSRYDKKDEELKKREENVTKAEAELYKKSIRKKK